MVVDPNVWLADFGLWRVYKPDERYMLRWDTESESYYLYWTDISLDVGNRLRLVDTTKDASDLQEMVYKHDRYLASLIKPIKVDWP